MNLIFTFKLTIFLFLFDFINIECAKNRTKNNSTTVKVLKDWPPQPDSNDQPDNNEQSWSQPQSWNQAQSNSWHPAHPQSKSWHQAHSWNQQKPNPNSWNQQKSNPQSWKPPHQNNHLIGIN